MAFEFFIVLALIIIFLISFCGFIRKLRMNYEEQMEAWCVEAQRQAAAVEVSTIAYGETNVAFQRTEEHFGVFPGNIAPPPPYSEYNEPPPLYEDVIKSCYIVMPTVHQQTQSANSNENVV